MATLSLSKSCGTTGDPVTDKCSKSKMKLPKRDRKPMTSKTSKNDGRDYRVEEPEGGSNMNMRDLSGTSGNYRPSPEKNSSYTEEERAKGKVYEEAATKNRRSVERAKNFKSGMLGK